MKKFHWLNEDERSSLVHDRYAIVYKGKNGITVGHVPKYVSKQMFSSINTVEERK